MISARGPEDSALIASYVHSCLAAFQGACKGLAEAEISIKRKIAPWNINDELGRFRLWSGNIGAHRRGRSSLDYRLREASHIRDRVIELLKNLEIVIREATEIILGQRVPWEDVSDSNSESDDFDDEPLLEASEATELQQLGSNMAEIITCLMRLSMAIRNPAPHDQYNESSQIDTSHYEPYDIEHVHGKFPNAAGYLVDRLGKAISRRRQYLRYREEHRKKLEQGFETAEVAPAEVAVPVSFKFSEEIQSTVASSIPSALKTSSSAIALAQNDLYEDTLSQTSYASSTNDPTRLRPPPLPEQGQDGEPFECPLCFRFTSVRHSSAWYKHVYRDLQPYVCSFRKCEIPDRSYDSRQDWFNHELRAHRRWYECIDGCNRPFQSHLDIQEHLQAAHPGLSSKDRLDDLIRTCEREANMDTEADCALCQQKFGSLTQLRRHLGKHHKELALFALPSYMKDEHDESDDDRDANELRSFASSVSVGRPESLEDNADDEELVVSGLQPQGSRDAETGEANVAYAGGNLQNELSNAEKIPVRPSSDGSFAAPEDLPRKTRTGSLSSLDGRQTKRQTTAPLSLDKPLPQCPRRQPSATHDDWYTLENCPDFDLCPSCYDGIFADTLFAESFKQSRRAAPPLERYCDFSSPWLRLAWLLTIKQQRPSLELIFALATITQFEPPCPSDTEVIRGQASWYGISDHQDGVHVANFAVCPRDVKYVEALLPSLKGYFTRLSTTSIPDFLQEHLCTLRVSSRRFPKYLDLLVELDEKSKVSQHPPDINRLVRFARELAFKRECPRDKAMTKKPWHYISSLPEFTVCEECYDEVIQPDINTKNSSSIAKLFNRTIQLVPGEDELGTSCCLYSSRMRGVWDRAVRSDDFDYLSRKAIEWKVMETRSRHERWGLMAEPYKPPEKELIELEREWNEWE